MLRHPCTGNICFSFAIQVFSSVYCKNYTRHGCERLGDYVAQVGRDSGDVRGGGAGGDPPPPPGQRGGVPGVGGDQLTLRLGAATPTYTQHSSSSGSVIFPARDCLSEPIHSLLYKS